MVRRSPGALGSEDWTGRRPLASGAAWVPGLGEAPSVPWASCCAGAVPPAHVPFADGDREQLAEAWSLLVSGRPGALG